MDLRAIFLGLSDQADWLSTIAQWLQLVGIFFSAIVIRRQLKQMRLERTHRNWEALQWAIDLLEEEDLGAIIAMTEDTGDSWRRLQWLNNRCSMILLAFEKGYLDDDAYFSIAAPVLVTLRKAIDEDQRGGYPSLFAATEKQASQAGAFSSVRLLTDKAAEWRRSQKTPPRHHA